MPERHYTVGPQRQVRAYENGATVEMYEIHYEGPNGVTGWVRVPVRTATPEVVDALIRTALDTQLGIGRLGSSEG